ncbi:large-conductance mechanosensitive channel [Aspergillus californicus]
MRGLDESTEAIIRVGHDTKERVHRAWEGFIDFAARDNVLEVALGLIIAQAFTTVVNSLVSDIILPVISLLPFLNRNMSEKFAVLSPGPDYAQNAYNTLEQARDDGALVLAYGMFLEKVLNFFGLSMTLYALAQVYMCVSHDWKVVKRSVKCRYCRKWISEKALRCVNCSSWQDGREDLRES